MAQAGLVLPALVLVSTPIGNLQDLSARAKQALAAADAILCEDTRTSAVLLRAHGIGGKCIALHEHNEAAILPKLIESMQSGQRFALISDAGTPLVSDPGYRLVRAAIEAGLSVSGVPGPNAAILALTLSGQPPQPFLFTGFVPPKSGARQGAFAKLRGAELAGLSATHVFYEAPHRLAAFLEDALAAFGPRQAAVCRELTKHFEEVRRGTLAELTAHYMAEQARGEIVVVIGPPGDETTNAESLDEALMTALKSMSVKDAAAAVAAATGLPKKQVYKRALELAGS
ncbi:16S rRNA (cytidine1402-2'-O)-methyltransferase [Acidocella aminolytica 101 = DSM 11237]|uniref:Ribosomal RNA small subunit methyltransferase I n=2 Tax=Acidocella TaxID=50709 RepID=A0A0D6PCA0_9PROT|nr:tetrapyrrole/corrin/porphyrin methyltransferase [Acidocella aminolytica 101 = DSM 11237]SHE39929.1 16S rRNA (cytidine1402-2'-O)-methyltransferase [Acidocella aminolytica 101 = DSM 11237]